ncbi:hypothetical protein J41TS4_17270 [Paenibacillus apis]|uniref:Transposase IS4-like domain-containing protein n=1 Tax=Paenibacillus apis TaxID=1792174 RepID=A0A919Y1G4_9BACL|nr:hypothetical protein [Paenibacillus apis]GIO41969.1 hypothetical protein J41TS4_17270 [Paenibacillus apis]
MELSDVQSSCGMAVKLALVQNRNMLREWLAILSRDLALVPNEIVRIYGMRWSIKVTKSYLKQRIVSTPAVDG